MIVDILELNLLACIAPCLNYANFFRRRQCRIVGNDACADIFFISSSLHFFISSIFET